MSFDLAVTDRLLTTTRAVRRRLDLSRPVEREVILECIDLSQQAPTASNEQSWRWVVVTDPGKRKELARLYNETLADYGGDDAWEPSPGLDSEQTRRVYASAQWLAEHLAEVPVHVIPCVEGALPGSPQNILLASLYGSIFPAVWSFQLALRSRGLGSALTTIHLGREREAAKLLGVPEGVIQVALLPVAYTVGTDFRPAARPGPETITHWEEWDRR
jgi:nitroreductase